MVILTLGQQGMLSTLEGLDNPIELPCPPSFNDQGMKWYPLRGIAEAVGYEVGFMSVFPGDTSKAVNTAILRQANPLISQISIEYEEGSDYGLVSMESTEWRMPVRISEGRLFMLKQFYEVFLHLTVNCYTSFSVFMP
ncbi:MAG: hypothetical protein FWE76_04625 [Symbiobacteriaceae bacterium]|nr:hypothetical protein [Symbiobacteriaceae bacterium]